MRRKFCGGLATLSITLLLMTGCAKDQVKPDEGIASEKPALSQPTAQQLAEQEAEKNRVAQQIAEQQAAAKREADRQAAMKAEQLKDQQAKADESAGLMRPAQATTTESAASAASAAESAKKALATIYFDFDSYALSQASRDKLYSNAEYLLKKYQGKVRLEGHCDERGSDEYNLALGEKRAKAAMNYLLTLGVPEDQLSIISYGKERPLVNEHNEEAWAQNRRVEFEIVK